jgi:hypothetical protein
LYDKNRNGKYTDSLDMIILKNYDDSIIDVNKSNINTAEIFRGKYFGIKNRNFEILEINEEKGYLIFTEDDVVVPAFRTQIKTSGILVKNQNNEMKTLSEIADGKYLYINFWYMYDVNLPDFKILNELSKEDTSNIKIIGALYNGDTEELLEFKKNHNIEFEQIFSDDSLRNIFQIFKLPTTIVIDPEGYIISTDFDINTLK